MLGRHLSSTVSGVGTRRIRRHASAPKSLHCCYAVRLASSAQATSSARPTTLAGGEDQHYDVLIVGGGAVGSTLASCLLRWNGGNGLRIGLVEFSKGPRPLSAFAAGGDLPNARAYALSPASLELINNGLPKSAGVAACEGTVATKSSSGSCSPGPIELLSSISPYARIAPYSAMQIWESNGPATLHFDATDLSTDSIDPHKSKDNSVGTSSDGDDGSGTSEATYSDMLGAVVEDGPLVSALWDNMQSGGADGIDLITNAAVKSIDAPSTAQQQSTATGAGLALAPPPPVSLTYQIHNPTPDASADGHPQTRTVTADLLVAADGGNSTVRRMLGMPVTGSGYGRRAVTCTVKVDRGRGGMRKTAYQRFMKNGPMALLPVWSFNVDNCNSEDESEEYANIVWSTTPSHATHLQSLSEEKFLAAMNDVMQSGPANTQSIFPQELTENILPNLPGPLAPLSAPLTGIVKGIDHLARGANDGLTMSRWSESKPFQLPPLITSVVGPRLAFDLSTSQAQSYVAPRVALVGDAAHTVHPMAGQGLNLGLGDVESLVRHYQTAQESGMDFGGTMHFLNQYNKERRAEVSAVLGGIHALHEFFATKFEPAVYVRSLGMNLINALGPVRRHLAEVAAGRRGAVTSKR